MSGKDEGGRDAQGRKTFFPLLGAAAETLVGLHQRWENRPDAVAAEIDRRLEGCAAIGPRDAAGAGERLGLLLRLRDLHRYVEVDPELKPFKLAVLGATVRQREPVRRWNEARGLIAGHLPTLLDARPEEVGAALKRDLSTAGSRLGRLLRLCALLNLEATGERPPPSLRLRFLRGRFPEHVWEPRRAGAEGTGAGAAWQPTAPLARWEYLAADLAERVFGTPAPAERPAWDGGRGRPGRSCTDAPAPVTGVQPDPASAERVYCRWEAAGASLAQLPLLPVQPETLLADLLRHVQRQLGTEGVRQAALILAAGSAGQPGEPFSVDVQRLSEACGPATRRDARERARRMGAVLRLLSEITVQRVSDPPVGGTGLGRMRTTRLLTLLGWEGAAGSAEPAEIKSEQERFTVLADRVLWSAGNHGLGEPFRELPGAVLALSPREHPYALVLAAHLRRHFAERPGVAVERGALTLAHEAGLAVQDAAPHRVLETLKRDLHRLQELGVVGRWRIAAERGVTNPPLRLEPPGHWKAGLAAQRRTTRPRETSIAADQKPALALGSNAAQAVGQAVP
jgi:hypothetical protein